MTTTPRTDYTTGSVARAAELLSAFGRAPHTFRLTELADQLGMTRNLTFRLLRTLEAGGMIFRVDDRYVLGPRTREIGRVALKRYQPLVDAAQPVLEELRVDIGETVYLCAMMGDAAVCLAAVESASAVRGVLDVGARLPLHAGGGTKALMAWLPQAQLDAIIDYPRRVRPFTQHTLSNPSHLRDHLARIRRDGYEVGLEEVGAGSDAVGVPVRDAQGSVVAGLGMVGPSDRVRPRLHDGLPVALLTASKRITQRLRTSHPLEAL
jgi:DNA-binding IclR family transcriptional regulator